MNVKLLRKAKNEILKTPQAFDMSCFADKRESSPCGTVGCIGGNVVLLTNPRLYLLFAQDKVTNSFTMFETARRALRLGRKQAERLFYLSEQNEEDGGHWPEDFETAYLNASTQRRSANIAAKRIEHFIKTKGRE